MFAHALQISSLLVCDRSFCLTLSTARLSEGIILERERVSEITVSQEFNIMASNIVINQDKAGKPFDPFIVSNVGTASALLAKARARYVMRAATVISWCAREPVARE